LECAVSFISILVISSEAEFAVRTGLSAIAGDNFIAFS
jgi:hypothetical protein